VSSVTGLLFGPIALRVEGPSLHPLLDPYRAPVGADARRVVVTVADELPPGTAAATVEVGFALVAHADHDHLTLRGDPSRPTPWLAAFCELVARDAPLHRCLLLHAGAVTVAGGVALLVAPPGVGKTTAVRAAAGRAFASNAVLIDLSHEAPIVLAMPFTREPAPELESLRSLPLAALAFVHRAPEPTIEWISGSLATIRLMPHVTRPRGADPHARARTDLALSMGERARALRLGMPRGPGYLAALDAALQPTTQPV
jgi:hypothetical protein